MITNLALLTGRRYPAQDSRGSAILPPEAGRSTVIRHWDPQTTLRADARRTTQTHKTLEKLRTQKTNRARKPQKRAKSPLECTSVPPTFPPRKALHPAHCSESQAALRGKMHARLSHPPRERPREFFSRFVGMRGFPRPSRKPPAAGAGASPRPELARAASASSPFKAPPPLPPPSPPPQKATLDSRHSTLFRDSGEVPPLGGTRGGAGRREGAPSGSVCRGRSGRRALVRERCRLPLPTEVGRGARRAVRDREDCPGQAQRGERGLRWKGLAAGEGITRPPGEGGQSATPWLFRSL